MLSSALHGPQRVVGPHNLQILGGQVVFCPASRAHFHRGSYLGRHHYHILDDHPFRSSSNMIESKEVRVFIWDPWHQGNGYFWQNLSVSVVNLHIVLILLREALTDLQEPFLYLRMSVPASMFIWIVLFVFKSAILDVFRSLVNSVQSVHWILYPHASIVLSSLEILVELEFATVMADAGQYFGADVNVATMPDGSDESDDANVSWTVLLIYKEG